MTRRRIHVQRFALFALLLVLFSATAVRALGGLAERDLVERIQDSVQAAGSYRFDVDVEQTLIPRPLPEMIGQTSQQVDLRIEGATRSPDRAYWKVVVNGGGLDVSPMTAVQNGERAFIQRDGELQPLDSPAGADAMASGYLSYLAGAGNLQPLPDVEDGTEAYSFEVDGRRLAEVARQELLDGLSAEGSLPPNVQLNASPLLAAMSGTGELWLNADGLPQWMILDLEQPGVSREYDARSHLVVHFYDYGQVDSMPQPVQNEDGTWRLEQTSISGRLSPGKHPLELHPFDVVLFLISLVVSIFVVFYRRYPRQTYAVTATLVIVSLVASPLFQSWQLVRFAERTARASEQWSLDIKQGPALGDDHDEAANPQAQTVDLEDGISRSLSEVRASQSSNSDPQGMCGEGEAGKDGDGDGLNDRTENCLGTNPYGEDSDEDGLSDKVEVDGFEWPEGSGRMWYGNPLKPDSNDDGLFDFAEWPEPDGESPQVDTDNDGVPNLWDEDNDADGVLDRIDLSPDAYTDFVDEFYLSTQGSGFDGYQFVEVQVRPEDPTHLRYMLSALNWPYDRRGQVQDLNSSKDDLQLLPMLQIETNVAPDREMARKGGVTVFEHDDGTYTLYATLVPVGSGGQIAAFSARVTYEPAKLDDIRWESARLVWAAQMNNDSWKEVTYGSIHGYRLVTEPTLLHMYDDSFQVTGLRVSKGRDFQSAVFGTPGSANDDRTLFQVLLGIASTFMQYQTPELGTVADRFANSDPNADTLYTWGVHPSDVAEGMPVTYGNRDEGQVDTNVRMLDFLDVHNYPHSSNPSLVVAMQEELGLWGMAETGTGQVESSFNVNLANISLATQRSLKLSTYDHVDSGWESLELKDTLRLMEERYSEGELAATLEDLQAEYPELTTKDLQTVVYLFYSSWQLGQNRFSRLGDDEVMPEAPADLDQQVYEQLHRPRDTNLAAYLLEVAELAQPGAGLRVGDSTGQSWEYQQANAAKVDAFNLPAISFARFCQTIEDMPTAPGLSLNAHLAVTSIKLLLAVRAVSKVTFATGAAGSWLNVTVGKLGLIGLGLSLYFTWMLFALGFATGEYSSPFAWKLALAFSIATTIITVILFVMCTNPIGQAISLVLLIVELFVLLFTWGKFSLFGKATEFLAKMFYDVRVLTEFEDMDYSNCQAELADPEQGYVVGSRFVFSLDFEGKITGSKHADDGDLRDSYAYGYFSTSASQAEHASMRSSTSSRISGSTMTTSNSMTGEFLLTEAKRNVKLEVLPKAKAKILYEECSLWGASCDQHRTYVYLPADLPRNSQWDQVTIYLDVLPNTVGDLWTWSEISNPDRDADKLSNSREAELGTDPDLWDSDFDGLSDGFEMEQQDALGTDPNNRDSDGDGLLDGHEYRIGTRIDDADTDGDGLTDAEEVYHDDGTGNWSGGWQVHNVPESSQTLWVFSDPLVPDADGDGLNDKAEKAYSASPYAYNDAPHLVLEGDPLSGSEEGESGVYLEPGDEITLTLTLESNGPDPISATLTLCLPDFLTDLQGGEIQGDRTPPREDASDCHGFQWDFSGPNTLQVWEAISTTVTATAANVASASSEVVVRFPYGMAGDTQDIEDRVSVVLDNDAPWVSISAPEEGDIIGGGVTEYVVGGDASDPTTWVDHVELQLPGDGTVTAEGVNPWAYTWSIPGDGLHTLTSTAYDYLGHASAADSVQVTVDNSAPNVTFDLPDRAVVTGEGTGTITVTLTGTATDNGSPPTGLARVQISLDGKPWREVWTSGAYPETASWTAEWELPGEDSAQGEHTALVRAEDRAGNLCDPLERTIIVDVVPPTAELANRAYIAEPPHVPVGETVSLYGVANDAGNTPKPSRPEELIGTLHGLLDATIWLGLTSVEDNNLGVQLAWLGDFNKDRLADLAIGLPAAEGQAGRVSLVNGRSGDWPSPSAMEAIAESRTSFVGTPGARIGAQMVAAGDVNGDGAGDLLVGDPSNKRAFLIFGSPLSLGRDLELDGEQGTLWSVLTTEADLAMGSKLAAAGDVNGDGFDDLLIGAGTYVYLLLGERAPWFDTLNVDFHAAARFDTNPADATLAGLGDVDGDQYDDFAIATGTTVYLFVGDADYDHSPPATPISVSLSDADDTFASATSDPQMIRLGDVNGDELADFVYQSGDAPQLVFGDDSHNWGTHSFDGFDPPPSGFLAGPGDVDGDGRCDLLIGNSHGDAYLVLAADLEAVQATLTGVAGAASAPYAAGADLNSDGSSDILLVPARDSGSGMSMASVDFGELPITKPGNLYSYQTSRSSAYAARSLAGITRFVNDDLGCEGQSPCYDTIQAAVDASDPGDTIIVQPGAYASFVVDGIDDLTISGTYVDAVFVDGAGGPFAAKIRNATGVTLDNMTLRDAINAILLDDAGVDGYQDPSLVTNLRHLLVYDFHGHALSMSRLSTVELVHSTLAGGRNHIQVTWDPEALPEPSWTELYPGDMPSADGSGGGLVGYDGLVYAALNAGNDDLRVYDPDSNTWASKAPMPISRTRGASAPVADEDGNLFLLPGSTWRAMGSGLSGGSVAVNDMATHGDDLYVVGWFTGAGGVAVNHIARWDGANWNDVGGGVSRSGGGAVINAVATDSSGEVYVAGDFDHAGGVSTDFVARWDGSQWHAVGSLPAVPTALAMTGNGTLYAGSCAESSGGIPGGANDLWQWESNTWTSITSRSIHDLAPSRADAHSIFMGTNTGVRRYSTEWGWRDWDRFFDGPVYAVYPVGDSEFYAGGDFTISRDGVTTHNLALIKYTCPGGGCSYNLQETDGGVNAVVHTLAAGRGNVYAGGAFTQAGGQTVSYVARWDGSQWHPLSRGVSHGTNDTVTTLAVADGIIYAGGDFTLAGGLSAAQAAQWYNPLYRYDIAADAWEARTPIPQATGEGSGLAADGAGHLYAIPGSDSINFYRYDVAADTWTQRASLPGVVKAGGALVWAYDHAYAFRGDNTRSFYRYDPAANSWTGRASIPSSSGVAAAGAGLAWDGYDWIYATLGGGGRHFLRYHIPTNEWEILGDGSSGTTDDHDTPSRVWGGGGLTCVGSDPYGIPGGRVEELWRFGPIVHAVKLTLNQVALVVPETATQGDWYNLPLDEVPTDFMVRGSGNAWVGGDATDWDPDIGTWPVSRLDLGEIVTHDQADFVDPDRSVYRLGAASTLNAGYCSYTPDVTVPDDYASIQDAVLSGAHRVLVKPGQYDQSFYMVSGVQIIGSRADQTVLSPPLGHTGPLVSAEGVVGAMLKGFTLTGDGTLVGLRAEGGTEHITLERCIVRDTATGIQVHGADTELEVVNNTVVDNDTGIVAEACAPVDVRNTILAYQSGTGLAFSVPPDGVAANWPLDEAAGATSFDDISGNGHTASCSGGSCPTAGSAGKHDGALTFDGVDDFVDAPSANEAGLQQLTVAAWVYLDLMPLDEIMRFVTLADEKAVLRYDGIKGPEQLHFYMSIDGSLRSIRVDHALQIRTWHHVAGTFDGHVMRLYLDGEQLDCLVFEGTVGGGTGVRMSHPTETLDGKLDDVRLYDRSLSAGEILGLYQGCDADQLHTYNLYWANGTDLDPAEPGPAEIFLDPRFVDALNHNYTTDDYSPAIDAGNPTDPHPPGTGERVDIGYFEQGCAAYYADDDYCPDCINDGLTWGVDAYDSIQEALDAARDEQVSYGNQTAGSVICASYRSGEVPLEISADRATEVVSSLKVPLRGYIVDVNLHSLNGEHERVSDLEFVLESPAGAMVRMLAPAGCSGADFDLHLDDEAAAGSPPCPPVDGGTYQPVQPLSTFDGDYSEGTWALHVRDEAEGEGGRLNGWGLEICVQELPPILTVGVGPGTYNTTVAVPSYVRLVGVGADDVTIDAGNAGSPVTFDGVVHAEVSGFALTGSDNGAGVSVRGGSNSILVHRNLIKSNKYGIDFAQSATGQATFNTIVGRGEVWGNYGIRALGVGSQAWAESNIVYRNYYGLYSDGDSNVYSDYNLLSDNHDYYSYGVYRGPHDQVGSSPGFVGEGDYHIRSTSSAVDRASPHEPVPPGGGTRADIGYHELVALPAAVFLGKEGTSTAIGNSGLAQVEAAVVPVSDLRTAPDETAPAAWETVYDDPAHTETKATWLLDTSPTVAGLHRIYSRAEDAVGNQAEAAADWHVGDFVADGTAPTVTWIAPPAGAVPSEVELRAQTWDEVAGQFSVETVQFEIDGDVVTARWAAQPWDPTSGLPRAFRAWVSLSVSSNPTVVAVAYDKAGNRGQSASVSLNVSALPVTPDTTDPNLTVDSPTAGGVVQPPVVFEGTASDPAGSGLESVEVSLDGGITWIPAAVTGSNWSLTWDPPWQQDYITFPAVVRARDKAGNTTSEAVPFAIDNVPPSRGGARFDRIDVYGDVYPTEPGQHLDYPTEIRIRLRWPTDGSDTDGGSLRYQMSVDQIPDTPCSSVGPWDPYPSSYIEEWFTIPGRWYIHIFYRDQAGNITAQHYGPWRMGNFADTLIHCNDRRQSIEVDGFLDLENNEWADHEFLDDDERGMELGHECQLLYAAWDGEGFYAAWQGAWWDVDGSMWVYLDRVGTSGDSGTNHTVEYPYRSLPFLANYAIRVDAQGAATRYYASAGHWQEGSTVEFGHGDTGGTEVRFPWEMPLNGIMTVRMLAYAEDENGQVWSAFPTTNPLKGDWNEYYQWNTLCNILYGISANQPRHASLLLELTGEFPVLAGWGPGVTLPYSLTLTNLEAEMVAGLRMELATTLGMGFDSLGGATCDFCPPLGDTWTLLVPPIPGGASLGIGLTGLMGPDLTGLDSIGVTATLALGTELLTQAGISHSVDNMPAIVEVDTYPGTVICTGVQTVSGSGGDGAGGGVELIQYSLDGGTSWLNANGTLNWMADINVPDTVSTLDFWVRAIDVFGQSTTQMVTFNIESNPPSLTLDLPTYLTGGYASFGGTTSDAEGVVLEVQVQMDNDAAPWKSGQVHIADDGTQSWDFGQPLPLIDGEDHQFCARAIDTGCNVSAPTAWQTTRFDNVAPQMVVSGSLDAVIGDDYPPGGSGESVLRGSVTDGSGVAEVQVWIVDPEGTAQLVPASLEGSSWELIPEFSPVITGEHTLRIQTEDVAGNLHVSDASKLWVCDTDECVSEHTYRVAIGNLVWEDANNNSIFDPTEMPLHGVAVELYQEGDAAGVDVPAATTTTDANGHYVFDYLTPGAYFVHIPGSNFAEEGALAGYASSTGAGGDDSIDHNGDENGQDTSVAGGISSNVYDLQLGTEPTDDDETGYAGTLADDNVNFTADFGFHRTIEAIKYHLPSDVHATWYFRYHIDVSNPGAGPAQGIVVTDVLPSGIAPWSVEVSHDGTFDPDTRTVTWHVPSLGPGDSIELSIRAQTFSWAARQWITNVACVDSAGLPQPICVSDEVYVQGSPGSPTPTSSPTPTGSPTLSESLTPTHSPALTSTLTSSPTHTPTPINSPTLTNTPTPSPTCTPTPTNSPTPTCTPTPTTGSILACVWNDLDGDGLQDLAEPGLAGVPIQLRDSRHELVDSCRTAASGCCTFTELPPGTYIVSADALEGFFFTTARSASVEVMAGQESRVNFGSRRWYTVSMPVIMKNGP